MAPSLNLFSRRKNSDELSSPSSAKSPAEIYGVTNSKLVKPSRSKESSPTSPNAALNSNLPRPGLRNRAATYGQEDAFPSPSHSRSTSDTWQLNLPTPHGAYPAEYREYQSVSRGGSRGSPLPRVPSPSGTPVPSVSISPVPTAPGPTVQKIYAPAPLRTHHFRHQPSLSISSELSDIVPPPISKRQSNSEPPTPITGAGVSPTSPTARKREFRFPLPISPPLSPETFGVVVGKSGGAIEEQAPTPQPVPKSTFTTFPPRSFSSMDTHVDHRDDQIHSSTTKQLLARVQDLEARNRELISEATLHSSRIQALRVSHGQLIDSMKESHAIEVDALRKQEWPAVVKGKEKELELLRNNNDGFKNRIQVLEARVRERDEEVNWMKEKLEKLERGGEEQEVAGMDMPEISRKLVDEMRRRKTAEQSAEDLMDMVTKITGRLAEEKTKNAALESNMSRITEDSWLRVSNSKHEIQKLRHSLEDREELLENLQVEMNVVKRERAEYREAWEREQTEHSSCQQTIEDREERIRDLEFESGDLRDRLELSQTQLEQLQKQSDVHEDILVKLVESSSSSSRCSHRDERAATPSVDENTEELRATIEKLQHDIKLYRSDIRAYRRDVKTRDKTIQELQSQLSTPVTPRTIPEDFPAPPSRLKEENDSLRRELENGIAVTKQQALMMKDMEAKMKALRREKEQMEAWQLRQLKSRMEQQPQKPTGEGYIIIGNGGEDAVRSRRTPSGRRQKEVVDLDIPPPNSPLPPPPPPRKDSVGPRTPGDDENEGETFVW
ncbi:Similar to hypothetical protein [Tuber melanosporum Mel28]; acc. no. XP_002839453 [Pyronema omphalodes CBS 100304]|uniref:Uncharacterized protein n=1 Tax=Pyronema omphalodes (strain CBS 100304) TaxID=1076935 RepID=U4LD18_PYROM|nr:Similar to hypothetical protein [Tuber melanosporum Mel28]; acc. no. XP_002839453 [Pyronema omphalodes CBS 100304]